MTPREPHHRPFVAYPPGVYSERQLPLQRFHPLTCPNRGDARHRRREGKDLGELDTDGDGRFWCRDCGYTQYATITSVVTRPEFLEAGRRLMERQAAEAAARRDREALAVDAGLIAKALRSVGRLMQFPRLWRAGR